MAKRVVVLFSGEGSNLQKLIEALPAYGIEVAAAITNRLRAGGIARAQAFDVPVVVIDHTRYETREAFDRVLVETIGRYAPDLTVTAGFMRILTPVFTDLVRAINIHPSLLPKYKGANAIEQSFQSGDAVCGVTVHWVNGELDGGEIIAQASFARELHMTREAFEQKIHALEYDLLPKTVVQLLSGD
ncbi:MAG TPA: phosphoribosylglycinamide formyltransferase [Chlorobaculum parvum]|uniref:Phosphoribosylglycinamide formyltransferase n=1 Tax=Chlorobaculum parvum TaxID=274539 RepID=A0A7C5HP07_9CHLB|nr:phosphoribosylglycinamide formyltransferase [Chlorobaculum parvum]